MNFESRPHKKTFFVKPVFCMLAHSQKNCQILATAANAPSGHILNPFIAVVCTGGSSLDRTRDIKLERSLKVAWIKAYMKLEKSLIAAPWH